MRCVTTHKQKLTAIAPGPKAPSSSLEGAGCLSSRHRGETGGRWGGATETFPPCPLLPPPFAIQAEVSDNLGTFLPPNRRRQCLLRLTIYLTSLPTTPVSTPRASSAGPHPIHGPGLCPRLERSSRARRSDRRQATDQKLRATCKSLAMCGQIR